MITRPKPDPQVYDLAFLTLDLSEADRAHTCAFDDDPRGIAAAHAAGLFVCGIATRHSVKELLSLPVPPNVVANGYKEYAKMFNIAISGKGRAEV
jgi:beta-phosphoglucomutase-like phosphatase (HAD superfamily)